MKSYLEPTGLFNPALRFAFTNVTDADFTSLWDGRPITVKPGQTVELPHHLAVKMTGELVDSIMMGESKAEEDVQRTKLNDPYWRSPKGMSLGVPAARKPYEDRILRQLDADEESPELQVLRMQIRSELEADLARQPGVPDQAPPSGIAEFAQLGQQAPAPEPKKPMKAKVIK